jgi:hypothetical protein
MANGIPALLNQVGNVINNVQLVKADAQNILAMFAGPQWGIAVNGSFVLAPDSILSVEYKRDWTVPDYPQELGAFQSYNKVATPFDVRVQMTKGGTEAEKRAFLIELDQLAGSLTLVTVITPTIQYPNANITHYDLRRTATNGVGLLTVDVWIEEIRVAPNPSFTQTAKPDGQDPQQTGQVQAQPATPAQSALASIFH